MPGTGRPTSDQIGADALRTVVDASPDGIMVVDEAGTICFANPAAEAIFGRDEASIVGSPFGIPLVAADKTDVDVARSGGVVDVFELRVTDTTWRDGVARLVTLRDVTERVRHEAEVLELNQQLQLRAQAATVLSHVGDGVVLLDELGIVRFWNPTAARALAVPAATAVGRHVTASIAEWRRVEQGVELAVAPDLAAARGQSIVLEVEGEELWLSITGVQFEGGTVYAFHDLTDEVRLDALKRDFIATASHELRTPLTSIYGAAHTLQRTELDLTDVQRNELVGVICTQAHRLRQITDDILTTSKLEEDGPRLQVERFDAGELATDVLETMRGQAHEGIELRLVDQLNGARELHTDQGKLRQVLANLVQNAVKYSPDGGEVAVTVARRDDCIQFEVRDQGVGIARGDLDMVFDKFFRASDSAHRAISGTGLGLYIARELLRRLDGHMWVDSHLGEGSTFFVRVPTRSPVERAPAGD